MNFPFFICQKLCIKILEMSSSNDNSWCTLSTTLRVCILFKMAQCTSRKYTGVKHHRSWPYELSIPVIKSIFLNQFSWIDVTLTSVSDVRLTLANQIVSTIGHYNMTCYCQWPIKLFTEISVSLAFASNFFVNNSSRRSSRCPRTISLDDRDYCITWFYPMKTPKISECIDYF